MLQDTVILRNFPDQTDKNHTISFIYGKVDYECPLYYIMYLMLGSKDALRIVPYFVLPQFYPIFVYREADAPLLCSYRGGSLSHKTTPVQAHRGFRLLTLASVFYYSIFIS